MSIYLTFILMTFCHIVDDYYLQGILASMKQKKWWEENAPEPLYKYDYLCALICHAFSWTFMIMLPLLAHLHFHPTETWYICFVYNTVFHAMVDHLKANAKAINLWTDQCTHLLQIVITLILVWYGLGG